MEKIKHIWQVAGFFFSSIVGVLLHFLYDWTGERILVALFSAVNESIWEHMKILFFSLLFFSIIQDKFSKKTDEKFWYAKLVGIMMGVLLIPMIYYTYTGVFGISLDWFNIFIFFIAVAVSYYIEIKIMQSPQEMCVSQETAKSILYLVAVVFMLFTLFPPRIMLFQDPVTGTYGIEK